MKYTKKICIYNIYLVVVTTVSWIDAQQMLLLTLNKIISIELNPTCKPIFGLSNFNGNHIFIYHVIFSNYNTFNIVAKLSVLWFFIAMIKLEHT